MSVSRAAVGSGAAVSASFPGSSSANFPRASKFPMKIINCKNKMKCAKLHLWERSKSQRRVNLKSSSPHPRRYCQKRMVDPDHEEDPRWADAVLERFHYDAKNEREIQHVLNYGDTNNGDDNIFLTVQNLQFQGNDEEIRRTRTFFKYRACDNSNKHRMFIKKTIEDGDSLYNDNYSTHDNDSLDTYVKFILNKFDQSRPSTSMSNEECSTMAHKNRYKQKENKAIQVDRPKFSDQSKLNIHNKKVSTKRIQKTQTNNLQNKQKYEDANKDDSRITFTSTGRRKSLTISRTQSPETVQVIRVDVVCNHSSCRSTSSIDHGSNKNCSAAKAGKGEETEGNISNKDNFVRKYLLTRTVKGLDERISGGAKVTLLCKTFHLAERTKVDIVKNNTPDASQKLKSKTKARR